MKKIFPSFDLGIGHLFPSELDLPQVDLMNFRVEYVS